MLQIALKCEQVPLLELPSILSLHIIGRLLRHEKESDSQATGPRLYSYSLIPHRNPRVNDLKINSVAPLLKI